MIWLERRMNVTHLLYASTFAQIFCMFKNVSVFPRVNVDAWRTSYQRQSNARHKWSTHSEFVVFPLSDSEKRRKLAANAQRVLNVKGEWTALH